ncbi:MAG: sensor histidine kinase [Thermodesulfobacteriota bacterium]
MSDASPKTIASLISRYLVRRTLLPAVACLVLLAAFLCWEQKGRVETGNSQLAQIISHYVLDYMGRSWKSLEYFAKKQADAPSSNAGLQEMAAATPSLDRLVRIGPDNTILSAAPLDERGLDFPLRFTDTGGGRLLLSRPLFSQASGDMTVFIGARHGGGILAGEVNLKDLAGHMAHFSTAWPGEIIVCDGYGNVISHPDRNMVSTQANVGGSPLFKAIRKGGQSLVYLVDGGLYLGAGHVVPELGWLVLIRTRAVSAFAPALAPSAGVAAVMGAVLMLLVLLVRRAMNRRIARPLAETASRLAGLEEGEVFQKRTNPPFDELASFETAIEDMTLRVRGGQEKLRESERRLRAIFEQAAVGLVQYAPDGRYLSANKRFQEICGYSLEELGSFSFQDITHPGDIQESQDNVRALRDGELQSFTLDKRYVRKDGEVIWVRATISAVRANSGEVDYFIGVVEDITARKAAEEALKSSLAEKEVLLREIHHRVKNNLQVISSLLYLQSENVTNPEALEMFRESRSRITTMALVHEELYRSSDLSGVNIREYVNKLVPRLGAAFGAGRGLEYRVEARDAELVIDQAIPFGLIVNELVTNAVKHAFGGRDCGVITVEAGMVDGVMCLKVSDNGNGLPAGFDAAATPTLGMQLILQLTKQLRGEIEIETGTGASFTMVFPVKESVK